MGMSVRVLSDRGDFGQDIERGKYSKAIIEGKIAYTIYEKLNTIFGNLSKIVRWVTIVTATS